WLDFRQPKPLAPGASDSIRPRSGHLSGRVAAPTRVGEAGGARNLTGAPPPQKRFSLGLHPVSLGKTKEMGWNWQRKVKTTNSKTASSSTPQLFRPGAVFTTPTYYVKIKFTRKNIRGSESLSRRDMT